MSTSTTHTLNMTRTIKASPERVFEAWTTPEQMKQWHAPEGVEVVSASVDLRVGGSYHVHMRSPEGQDYNVRGVYREIKPGGRLVYTWKWEEPEHDVGESVISVSFHAVDGGTRIDVVHDLFPSKEARDDHDEGWGSCLNRLEKLLG